MADTVIKTRLEMSLSGDAQRGMTELAKSTKTAADEQARFARESKAAGQAMPQAGRMAAPGGTMAPNRPMAPGAPGGAGGPGVGGMAGMAGLGELSAVAAPLAAIWAGIKGVSTATQGLADAIKLLGNESLTTSQKTRLLTESLPIIGEVAKSFNSLALSVSGAAERMRKEEERTTKEQFKIGAEGGAAQQKAGLMAEQDRVLRQARLQQETPRVEFKPPTGFTREEELERERQTALLPIRREQRTAGIEQKAAAEAETKERAERDQLIRKAEEQARLRDEAQARARAAGQREGARGVALPGPGFAGAGQMLGARMGAEVAERPGRLADSDKAIEAQQRHNELLKQAAEANNRLKKATEDRAAADLKASQLAIKAMETELQLKQQQLAQAKGAATAFGGLTDVEREAALQVSQRAKEVGFGGLSPEEKALLSQAGGGEFVQREQLKSGMADTRQGQFLQNLGLGPGVQALQKQVIDLQAQISATIQIDEAKLAQQLADRIVKVLDDAMKLIDKRMKGMVKEFELKVERLHAGQ